VVAYAGKIMGASRGALVTDDKPMKQADVAQTMLNGQALLDPQAKGVGKFAIPADSGPNGLRMTWSDTIGDAFRGDGAGEAEAYKAYRAMYAGLAAKAGKSDGALDENLAEEAARATVGNVIDWNGKMVLPPYGMREDEFKDSAAQAWQAKRTTIPGNEDQDLDAYDLDRIGDGVYVVSNGQAPVRGADGQPVIIRVSPNGPPPPPKPSLFRRAVKAVGDFKGFKVPAVTGFDE
jgi:hypothetical protein